MKYFLFCLFIAIPLHSRTFEEIREAKTSMLKHMMVFHHLSDSIQRNSGHLFQLDIPSQPLREGQSDSLLEDGMNFMPWFVLQTIGTYSQVDGPNCWNTTLNFNDPSIGIKNTTMFEMIKELDESYYQIDLRNDIPLQMGDIISLWRPDVSQPKELLHSTLYLGNGITFNKHSWEKNSPYVFSTIEAAFDLYDLDTKFTDHQSMYKYTVHRLNSF